MSKSRDTIAKATFEVVATKLVQALEMDQSMASSSSPITDPDFPLEAQNVIKI